MYLTATFQLYFKFIEVSTPIVSIILRLLAIVAKIFLILLFIPFFILFICPIYIFRFIIKLSSKHFCPDLTGMLPVRDTFYGIDNINSNPKSSIVVTWIIQGKFTREIAAERMQKVMDKYNTEKDKLQYPELRQYLVKWMGFLFWKQDEDFHVENHVKYIQEEDFTHEELDVNGNICEKIKNDSILRNIETKLINEPFRAGQSAWEIQLLENYKPNDFEDGQEYTAYFFKIHHSFVDGYSLLHIAAELVECDFKDFPHPNFQSKHWIIDMLINVVIAIKAPYDLLSEIFMACDANPWYLTEEKRTNQISSATSDRIPSQIFKDIAKHFKVSFTSVVVAALSGGIRRMMLRDENVESMDVKDLSCLCPFPVEGHPDTLGNYLSDCYIQFPIEVENPIERVLKVESQLQELKNSTVPLSSFVVQPVFGGLFHWMLEPIVQFALSKCSGIISSFPFPREQVNMAGFPIQDAHFSAGHDNPAIGIQFLAINYNGGWKLKIQADQGVLPTNSHADQLLHYFNQELDMYLKLAS